MTRDLVALLRLLVASAALASFAAVGAPPLLLPHDGPVPKGAEKKRFKSEGKRVTVNVKALKDLRPGDEVEFALPNGKVHKFTSDFLQQHRDGSATWHGVLKDGKTRMRAIVTTGPAGTFGTIDTPDGSFRLVPGPGHDWLVDMEAEAPFIPPIELKKDYKVPPPMPKAAPTSSIGSPDWVKPVAGFNSIEMSHAIPEPVFVDLLVVYSTGLKNNLGTAAAVTTRVNQLIAASNAAYVDSEVGIVLRLAGTTEVNYSEANDSLQALEAITPVEGGGTGVFSGIESLRTSVGADMVAFLRDGSDFGGDGIAWLANAPITSASAASGFKPYMYSVTSGCVVGCDFVFIHELGHNMGNAHDRATAAWQDGGVPIPGSYPYSFGHYSCSGGPTALSCNAFGGTCTGQPECNSSRNGTNNFADIMAYFHNTTTRNLVFSNPHINCSGALGVNTACGIAEGQAGEANAAKSMNNNRVFLSAMVASALETSTTTLVSSLNPSTVGQSVTFTATVTGDAGTPAGNVAFAYNGNAIAGCTAVALSAGAAMCTTSALPAGNHWITATYSGNETYGSSFAPFITQVVNVVKTTPPITLSSSANPQIFGQNVVFVARISGSGATPTGTVVFRNGMAPITGCTAVTLSAGMARCNTSTIPVGAGHSITAEYTGNDIYNAATSTAVTQQVLPAQVGAMNVAAASAGGVASASSGTDPNFPVSSLNNGDRRGVNWGTGGGWKDATPSYPDWVQADFGQATVDRVVLYSLQDNPVNPVEPTDAMEFTAYGVTAIAVEAWNGSAWVQVGQVAGNNLVKRTVAFPAVSTARIRVTINGALGTYARAVELEVFGVPDEPPAPPPPSTNLALASAGAIASASSVAGASFPIASINNGDRRGLDWGAGGGWKDATSTYPDWVQVDFNAASTIDRIVLFSLQDNVASPVEPTDAMTFSSFGVTHFNVQGWNGSTWVTLATVSGNNLVKRSVSFTPMLTERIRVNITAAMGPYSRLVELEAYGSSDTPPPPPPTEATNLALSSAGSVASASSTAGASFPIASINNGDRRGLNWGAGGGWKDATAAYPDWVQVNFPAESTVESIVLFSLQDNVATPVEPTDAMTFSSFGVTHFNVQGWNGSAWVTLATVSGNNLVKRTVTFTPMATDRIRVNITAALGPYSRLVELEAWGTAGSTSPPTGTNVALSSAGAAASASSTGGVNFPVASLNNGDRRGLDWGAGGGWKDATDTYPDWVQVDFGASRTIDRVVVYSLQDNPTSPVEPSDAMTFAGFGITSFDVQAWNGSAWVPLATVTGNNLVKRSVSFTPIATDRVRVNINAALGAYSRMVELEAWGN